jgi:DNA-binding MarR family transcriptional regulator
MIRTAPIAEADTAALLASVGLLATRCLANYLEPTDLSPRTTEAMLALRDAPLSQQALAERLDVHPVTLVALLNDLESAGLVVRRRDAADRRRHTVTLSELGRARMAAVDIAREKRDAVLFKGITAEQRATLTALLEQITANLRT